MIYFIRNQTFYRDFMSMFFFLWVLHPSAHVADTNVFCMQAMTHRNLDPSNLDFYSVFVSTAWTQGVRFWPVAFQVCYFYALYIVQLIFSCSQSNLVILKVLEIYKQNYFYMNKLVIFFWEWPDV